jgi:hypothetical protein
MRDAREKESMAGLINDGRGDEFDQGHARRVRGCGLGCFLWSTTTSRVPGVATVGT